MLQIFEKQSISSEEERKLTKRNEPRKPTLPAASMVDIAIMME